MSQTRLRMAAQMTRAQALRLRQLSEEAYQPRQFEPKLTQCMDRLRFAIEIVRGLRKSLICIRPV